MSCTLCAERVLSCCGASEAVPQPGVGRGLGGHRPGPHFCSPVLPQPSVDSAGSVGTPQINIHANGREGADGRTGRKLSAPRPRLRKNNIKVIRTGRINRLGGLSCFVGSSGDYSALSWGHSAAPGVPFHGGAAGRRGQKGSPRPTQSRPIRPPSPDY